MDDAKTKPATWPDVPEVHSRALSRVVGDLAQALHRSDSEAAAEARDLVRRLIETVVVTPLPERDQYVLTVQGKNPRSLAAGVFVMLGCGSRI